MATAVFASDGRDRVLRHGRDVHPTWVKSSIETLSNTKGVLSTRAKSEEDFVSY